MKKGLSSAGVCSLAALLMAACSGGGGNGAAADKSAAIVTDDKAAWEKAAGPDKRMNLEEFQSVTVPMRAAMDADSDGALSAAELAVLPEGRRRGWLAMDEDRDGALSTAELGSWDNVKFTTRDRNSDRTITVEEIPAGNAQFGWLF